MLVLGLETSCDETAAAIVSDDRRILSNVVVSQIEEHAPFGGVVPELAARSHLTNLAPVVRRALSDAEIGFEDLDGIAATAGPGLIGGVMVGVTAGKSMAMSRNLPFAGVNHLEAHALTARLTEDVAFPYLLLLVSGGHCQFLAVENVGEYRLYGSTIDDAVGEAFDKTAKLLGLGYPGGPALERAAQTGDPTRFKLPRPMRARAGCDFSFAGLKTAVRQQVQQACGQPNDGPVDLSAIGDDRLVADMAASFQQAVADIMMDRARHALAIFAEKHQGPVRLVVAGGVAANQALRAALVGVVEGEGGRFFAPPIPLCTDNGAMVAWAGIERLRLGMVDGFDLVPRPRWPLDPDATIRKGSRAHGVTRL